MYQKIQKSPSDNYPTQLESSHLAQRSTAQAKQNSPKPVTQSENEKGVFEQDRSEVSQLQLKEKSSTLTSAEQQKLGVLQAKMNDSWVQKREKAAQYGHNIANIPVNSTAMIQKRESQGLRPNKTGLPDRLKTGLENLSGHSMDDVKVHYNSEKPAEIQAHAYAQGTDIHVAPGQEKHLPHEGWHVAQNKQGRVKPTVQAKGVQINNDLKLEKEADVMGAKALRLGQKLQSEEAVQRQVMTKAASAYKQSTIQRSSEEETNETSQIPNGFDHLLNGIEKTMDENTIVQKLLQNFYKRTDFNYTGASKRGWVQEGDCSTLVWQFIAIAQTFNISMELKTQSAELFIKGGGKIIGSGQIHGNVDNGNHWRFDNHVWAEWNGNKIDVLFGQTGLKSSVEIEEDKDGTFKIDGTTYYVTKVDKASQTNRYTSNEVDRFDFSTLKPKRKKERFCTCIVM